MTRHHASADATPLQEQGRGVCEITPTGQETCYDRIVGGDGCELTVVRHKATQADLGAPSGLVYPKNESLPDELKRQLPEAIQTIFREAYNHAWRTHVMPIRRGLTAGHHEVATRAGWAAVKRLYTQIGSTWVRRRDK